MNTSEKMIPFKMLRRWKKIQNVKKELKRIKPKEKRDEEGRTKERTLKKSETFSCLHRSCILDVPAPTNS
jgi:hypothetical protein